MKGKCFKFHKAKERPSRPKSVSQKRSPIGETGLGSQRMPDKITTDEKNNWVSSAQSCSEESKNIKQKFMNKGAVPQGTKD